MDRAGGRLSMLGVCLEDELKIGPRRFDSPKALRLGVGGSDATASRPCLVARGELVNGVRTL